MAWKANLKAQPCNLVCLPSAPNVVDCLILMWRHHIFPKQRQPDNLMTTCCLIDGMPTVQSNTLCSSVALVSTCNTTRYHNTIHVQNSWGQIKTCTGVLPCSLVSSPQIRGTEEAPSVTSRLSSSQNPAAFGSERVKARKSMRNCVRER
jgi:hypothetical protein